MREASAVTIYTSMSELPRISISLSVTNIHKAASSKNAIVNLDTSGLTFLFFMYERVLTPLLAYAQLYRVGVKSAREVCMVRSVLKNTSNGLCYLTRVQVTKYHTFF